MAARKLFAQKAINAIEGYDSIVSELSDLIESARRVSARSVNAVMTASYWEIGRRIVESEQRGKKRAGYGEALLERLGADLTAKFGRGFGARNLWLMRRFFVHWREDQILQTVSAESQSVNQGPLKSSESMDAIVTYLEPSLVARVITETIGLDPTRTVVPPLDGFRSPELFSAMLAVDAELRAGGVGGPLLAESFANVLAVHLIRHITNPHRLKASADGALPRQKLRTAIAYIMENLEGNLTLEEMGRVVHLSPYYFARQFKAATGSAPYQFVINRRIDRAQHLLRTNRKLGLAEIAFLSGFANQSHFCSHFKRIVGVTPRQFRVNANGRADYDSDRIKRNYS